MVLDDMFLFVDLHCVAGVARYHTAPRPAWPGTRPGTGPSVEYLSRICSERRYKYTDIQTYMRIYLTLLSALGKYY